jgi:DNA-binding NtrC family response regulator
MNSLQEIKTLSDKERELLQKALARAAWNLAEASRLLQISVSQLRHKIREHGLKQDTGP